MIPTMKENVLFSVLQECTNYKKGGVGGHHALAVLQGGTNYKRGGMGVSVPLLCCKEAPTTRGVEWGCPCPYCAARRHQLGMGVSVPLLCCKEAPTRNGGVRALTVLQGGTN